MTTGGRRRPGAAWPIAVLVILVAGSIVVLERLERAPGSRSGRARQAAPERPGTLGTTRPVRPEANGDWVPVDEPVARIAIVIDDVGFEERPALDLASIGLPLTFAILPRQRYSTVLSEKLATLGHEVILHLPMEPEGYPRLDPGEGAVRVGMPAALIAATIAADLEDVPGARGLSNHMGSRATADPAVMRVVLEEVRRRRLYFLDSRTTEETVGFSMAREMGIPTMERGMFLDDRREASYIESQVRGLLRRARAEGAVLAIGHADAVTVEVLRRSAGLFRSEDIRVVPASELAIGGARGAG